MQPKTKNMAIKSSFITHKDRVKFIQQQTKVTLTKFDETHVKVHVEVEEHELPYLLQSLFHAGIMNGLSEMII